MKKKILIIDDNDQDQKIMERYLKGEGFTNICFASTGKEGIEMVREQKPSIVIIDTLLPGKDGFEVCRDIRKMAGDDIKLVMITGLIDAIDAVKARKMGADDYCVKTHDYSALVDAIKKLSVL